MRSAIIAFVLSAAAADAFSVPGIFVSGGILHPTKEDTVLKRRPEETNGGKMTITKAGGTLIDEYTRTLDLTPFERIALTCYGNLQVVFSAFHMETIDVKVDLFEQVPVVGRPDAPTPIAEWDRIVTMTMNNDDRLFCLAKSRMRVYEGKLYQTVSEQEFGIGQLLRWKSLQPKFELHEAGRLPHGGMWRFYSIDCPGKVEMDVLEEFPADALVEPTAP